MDKPEYDLQLKSKVDITYRGWQGHFICKSEFHLNTLVKYKDKKIVVSTVGNTPDSLEKGKYMEIGFGRKFETMAFEADDSEWNDADVTKRVYYDGEWSYNDECQAQIGHMKAVIEIVKLLREGDSQE